MITIFSAAREKKILKLLFGLIQLYGSTRPKFDV